MYGKITITKEVEKEAKINLPDWINIKEVLNKDKVRKIMTNYKLHKGEAESIVLDSGIRNCLLISNDKDAIDYAYYTGIVFKGTVGIIFETFRKGIKNVDELKETFKNLKKTNFYIDKNTLKFINDTIEGITIKPLACIKEYKIDNGNLINKYNDFTIYNVLDISGKIKHSSFGKAEKVIYTDKNNEKHISIEIKEPYGYNKYKNHIYEVNRDCTLIETQTFMEQFQLFKNTNNNKINKTNKKK